MWNDVRAQPSLETTAWSLLLAFLGAIVSMYVVGVVGAAGQDPAYGPLLTFIAFPLMGAIVAVPLRLAATLLTWRASF